MDFELTLAANFVKGAARQMNPGLRENIGRAALKGCSAGVTSLGFN